jgi:hypothetical protein
LTYPWAMTPLQELERRVLVKTPTQYEVQALVCALRCYRQAAQDFFLAESKMESLDREAFARFILDLEMMGEIEDRYQP